MAEDTLVPDGVAARFETLIEEAETIGSEYRNDGWDVQVIHTGDVTALFEDPFGLDVLAPGSEYEQLEERADGISFDRSHVYRAEEGDSVFFVVVVESTDEECAVVVPVFLSRQDLRQLEGIVLEREELQTHVRPLSNDTRVTFTHDDLDPFFE